MGAWACVVTGLMCWVVHVACDVHVTHVAWPSMQLVFSKIRYSMQLLTSEQLVWPMVNMTCALCGQAPYDCTTQHSIRVLALSNFTANSLHRFMPMWSVPYAFLTPTVQTPCKLGSHGSARPACSCSFITSL